MHAQPLGFGHTGLVSDLFGMTGRKLLERLDFPEWWRGEVLEELGLDLVVEREATSTKVDVSGAPERPSWAPTPAVW